MEYKIEYLTDKKFSVNVIIKKVTDGVYLIYCDFYERFYVDAIGVYDGWFSIYFGDEQENLIEVKFKPEKHGYLFGELCKKTYHGTFYEYETYCKIIEE